MNKKTVATSLVEVATVFYSNIFPKIVKKYQNGIKVPVIIRHFLLCLKQKRGEHYETKKSKGVIGSQKIC